MFLSVSFGLEAELLAKSNGQDVGKRKKIIWWSVNHLEVCIQSSSAELYLVDWKSGRWKRLLSSGLLQSLSPADADLGRVDDVLP